jgi:hypothetical protein
MFLSDRTITISKQRINQVNAQMGDELRMDCLCALSIITRKDAAALATALNANEDIETAIGEFSAERTKAGNHAVDWTAHLGSYFQMDKTGHRRADFSDRPPISPEYTGATSDLVVLIAGHVRSDMSFDWSKFLGVSKFWAWSGGVFLCQQQRHANGRRLPSGDRDSSGRCWSPPGLRQVTNK